LRYLYALVGLSMLLSAAMATVGAYNPFNPTMTVATYVDAGRPNTSLSDEESIWAASSDGKPVKEVFMTFNNTFGAAKIFNPDKVKSATLKINAKSVTTPGTIKAYLNKEPTMKTVTWSDKLDYDSSVSSSQNVQNAGDYSIDVTSIMKQAVKACSESCPYTIVLVADGSASIEFSKGGSQGPTLEFTAVD
jgi:hypothetical protein